MAGRGTLVLILLALSSGLCSADYNICNIQCCNMQPNCEDALLVDCECPDLDSLTLRKGDVPPSVQSIYISGPGQLTFQRDAFYHLPSLVTLFVDLEHEGELNVDENGLALRDNNDEFFLKIENAKVAVFANSAFAGFWTDHATIKLQSVQSLHIQQNSFSFKSKGNGPSLSMDYVDALHLAPYALNAPIGKLHMSNVDMPKCLNGSFGGKISRMEMNHVTISRIRKGCMETSHMSKLSISSSSIETVQSQGFSGKMRKVKIQDSVIGKIEQDGFSLQVATLCIENCRIDELMTNGLSVTANDSIDLEDVSITTLRKRALTGLQVLNNHAGFRHALHIHDINITHAERGSLAVSDRTKLRLTGHLNIPVPDPPVCPPEKWVLWLVGQSEREQLSDANKKVRNKVKLNDWLCSDANSATLQNSDNSQEHTETNHSEQVLGDEETDLQRTRHKVPVKESLTPSEEQEIDSRGTTPKPDVLYETEVTALETPLQDDAINPPRTSHMTLSPQQAEVDGTDPQRGRGLAPPKTTPMTAISQETGISPETKTSIRPGVNPNGDVRDRATASSKEMAGALSAGEIVAIALVVSAVLATILLVAWYRVTKRESGKGQVDSPSKDKLLHTTDSGAAGGQGGQDEQTNQMLLSQDIAQQSGVQTGR